MAARLLGFAWVGRTGGWLPLAALAVLAAARRVLGDARTRRLLCPGRGDLALGAAGDSWPWCIERDSAGWQVIRTGSWGR